MTEQTIERLIQQEYERQMNTCQLIASENFTSPEVMAAQGSVLTNKYAEGYPGKRYYAGCDIVDEIESSAIKAAKDLFNAAGANVQPHSGSQANAAVYLALLKPGDTILSMSMAGGGHLSHGASVNMSSHYYQIVNYGLNEQDDVDYDQVRQLARLHKPKLIIAGYSAFTKDIRWDLFREIADEVGAYLLGDIAHTAGLIAAGLLSHPFPHAHVLTSTTHKTLRGPRSGLIMMGDESLVPLINRAVFPGLQGGPLMHVIAAKAIALRQAGEPSFRSYQEQVLKNAKALAKGLQDAGIRLIGGGTSNHTVLIDLRRDEHPGSYYEAACESVGIILNKNCVFNDPRPPMKTSGLRLGTPALTTRGMKESHMYTIAGWISDIIKSQKADTHLSEKVRDLCSSFPLYSK